MKVKVPAAFFLLCIFCVSCSTVKNAKGTDNSGMMFAMIYDHENIPVSGVHVFINEKKIAESDTQGRFVLDFRKPGEYAVSLTKAGYEPIEQQFSYDPMNVLYFKMVNASQLLTMAEDALDRRRFAAADDFLERALVLDPYRTDVLYLKAVSRYLQQRDREAAEVLELLAAMGNREEPVAALLQLIRDRAN
ncbi:carboxypeptidase-like regulatory domain-containing protein [Breznakiella homolactica]|uniref:Carboxypeptidase regulatory-like domain-containing protein n=1 Tax=Breznakiella homolactica TaxID=2798577 RepID=A0A7T7XQR4_9SPIR|nr:carboxypeptidase-like regulatory domain-containing protein [Breznakiella homolactica]QQO10748.1 carboxypeptidase-like regulatory domain-containing protein [Breznakiella homolactica]